MTKLASHVSAPPVITADDLTRVQRESDQLHLAFEARTRGMEDVQDPELRSARRSLIIRRHRVMLQAELRAARMMPEDEDGET